MTKYDKIFGRKNQTILSSHYSKLVEQGEKSGFDSGDSQEDFFSLKRADHDLPADLVEHSDLSKRKIRMMKSKKTLVKSGPRGTKLVFDEDGQAHMPYEFKDVEDVDVERDGAEFIRKEIGKMQRADAGDKAVAKEKKKEKKRKRKAREREEVSLAIISSTILRIQQTQCPLVYSVERMGYPAALRSLLPLTTTVTSPLYSISRLSRKTIGRTPLPHRRKDPARRTGLQLRWKRRKRSRSSSCDGRNSYCFSAAESWASTLLRIMYIHR